MQFFVDHDQITDTFISSAHVPAGKRMNVAARWLFQYCGKTFIPGSRMVSTASLFSKIQLADLRIVELLKNVHLVTLVQDCDARWVGRTSGVVHSVSLLSGA